MHKIKITKRQRKAIRGVNAAMLCSLKFGAEKLISGVKYVGQAPIFKDLNANVFDAPPNFAKVKQGIPFVRVTSA